MSFRFNFSHEADSDIEPDDNNDIDVPMSGVDSGPTPSAGSETDTQYTSKKPEAHSLEDLLTTLPPNISYTTLTLPIAHAHGKSISLPRRELYDVRMQIMAEDEGLESDSGTGGGKDGEEEDAGAIIGLGNEDIRTATYEGGFKSWESSVDLVGFLAERVGAEGDELLVGGEEGGGRILELGCGTSLPTLFVFQYLLNSSSDSPNVPNGPPIHAKHTTTLTLTDFNHTVLRLVTLPNLFLTWYLNQNPDLPASGDIDTTAPISTPNHPTATDPKALFLATLAQKNITINFLSGSWGAEMSSLLLRGPTASAINHYDLILASETIYSPTTTPLFTRVVLDVLRPDGKGRALVAAKEIYFGVGGGVMDFMKGVNEGGGARENKEGRKWKWTAKVVKEVRDAGVARGVVEVRGEGEGAVG